MIKKLERVSYFKFFLELFLFLWVEYAFYFSKFELVNKNREFLFLFVLSVWLILSFLTHKFRQYNYSKNYWKSIYRYLKFYFYFILLMTAVVYLPIFEIAHQKYFIFSSFIYVFWSFALETILYTYGKSDNNDEINLKLIKATTYPEIVDINTKKCNSKDYYFIKDVNSKNKSKNEFYDILANKYLNDSPMLFNFISETIDISCFSENNSKIIRSADPYNVKTLNDNSVKLFINLHELNDLRRINEYIILLNEKLTNHGVYVGKFEPIRFRYKKFVQKYPRILSYIFYSFDFMWKRVCPKLPVVQKFYFAVTKGKDRALSLSEGLGRLYYSGYEVIAVKEIGDFIYFIAVKIKAPSTDKNPSYGPLFKMKRIGKNGNWIYVYKLRTMHPYSEYLHEYILKNYGYGEIGKPANDFRITIWGKIARKFWLDELPQLINVVKGEMKLVGVRPLSERFLKEYPEDIKKMRFKHKPGCVPPYVALLKQNVNEYIESEKIYLIEKEKHPFLTDIKYFFKAIYNILTNKIRSA